MQPASCPSLVAEVDKDVILAGIIEGFCRLQRTLNAGVLQPVPCRAHGVTGIQTHARVQMKTKEKNLPDHDKR